MGKVSVLFLFFLTSVSGYAQTLFDVLDPKRTNNTALLSTNEKSVDGSPNLFADFKQGKVFYGKQETPVPVNLDLYNNQLLIRLEQGAFVVNPARVKKIQIQVSNDSLAEFRFINTAFMQTLYEDSSHATYVSYRVKIKKGASGNGYQAGTNDSFDLSRQYEMLKPYALTFSDSKDLLKKLNKSGNVSKEKLASLGKVKGDDKNRIIFIVKNL